MDLTIELKLFCFFHQYDFFLLQVLLVKSSVGTTESTDIPYAGVKVNLYEQTEY